MNIHFLLSDLQEFSGEMQHIKALQHSSIMENHGVAVAAKRNCIITEHQDFLLNCRCLLKSHICDQVTRQALSSTKKEEKKKNPKNT